MQLNAQSIVVRRFIAALINWDSRQLDTVASLGLPDGIGTGGTDAR